LRPLAKPAYIERVSAFIFAGRLKDRVRIEPECVAKISLIDLS
jgi:hypothetical protein